MVADLEQLAVLLVSVHWSDTPVFGILLTTVFQALGLTMLLASNPSVSTVHVPLAFSSEEASIFVDAPQTLMSDDGPAEMVLIIALLTITCALAGQISLPPTVRETFHWKV